MFQFIQWGETQMKIRVNTHDKQLIKVNAITSNKIKKMSTRKFMAM